MRFKSATKDMGEFVFGTKQGCPLSPIICVLMLGILIHTIKTRTGVDIGGFVDDIGIIFDDKFIWMEIISILNMFCSASAMRINFHKSVLLNFLNFDFSKVGQVGGIWICLNFLVCICVFWLAGVFH